MQSGISHIKERYGYIYSIYTVLLFCFAVPAHSTTQTPDCYISYQDYTQSQSNRQYLLVDLRRKDRFNNTHIPGSINLPAYQLYSKSYLKNKPLILIGKGPETTRLYRICQKLREAGYMHTFVLQGGLYSWLKHDAPLSKKPANENLYFVGPEEMMADPGYREYILLNVSDNDASKLLDQYVKKTINTDSAHSAKKLLAEKSDEKIIVSADDDGVARTLVMAATGRDTESRVFLRGGVKAFVGYHARHTATLAKDKFDLEELQGCTN